VVVRPRRVGQDSRRSLRAFDSLYSYGDPPGPPAEQWSVVSHSLKSVAMQFFESSWVFFCRTVISAAAEEVLTLPSPTQLGAI
jgi:hypothetical protein